MKTGKSQKVAVVIPARYASTRFPGKPLIDIAGSTMIERVFKQAKKSELATDVLVATDDQRIFEHVKSFGGNVIMTSSDHLTGTDRLAEVAEKHADFDIVVNVQGDEPLIDPATIDAAIAPLLEDKTLDMSTIAAPIKEKTEILSNTVVKVVFDTKGKALYFSRLPIPYYRESDDSVEQKHFAHIGLYVYRRHVLLKIASLAPTALEQAEALEQLRALENAIVIKVVQVEKRSPAVDRPEDIKQVLEALAASSEISRPVETGKAQAYPQPQNPVPQTSTLSLG